MKLYGLTRDVKVFCVEARSFPKGIKAAFEGLNKLANLSQRNIFGISKPHNGVIGYRAAASENFAGEGAKLSALTFTIEKGIYLGEALHDWQNNEMMIMSIFNRLIADKRLDGAAHCIEWYKNNTELLCLVLMQANLVSGDIQELKI